MKNIFGIKTQTILLIFLLVFVLSGCQKNAETKIEKETESLVESYKESKKETDKDTLEESESISETAETTVEKQTGVETVIEKETVSERDKDTEIEIETETEVGTETVKSEIDKIHELRDSIDFSNKEVQNSLFFYAGILDKELEKILKSTPNDPTDSNAYNLFALEDLTGDGIPEMILSDLGKPETEINSKIYSFIHSRGGYEVATVGPYSQYYDNGLVIDRPHTPNLEEYMSSPFNIIKLDYITGKKEVLYHVYGKDSNDVENSPYQNGEQGEVLYWHKGGPSGEKEILTATETEERVFKMFGGDFFDRYPNYFETKTFERIFNLIKIIDQNR